MRQLTGSILYALTQRPHRVALDAFGNAAKREPVSPFAEMLWQRGFNYEREVVEGLKMPLLDLSDRPPEVREAETLAAMQRRRSHRFAGAGQSRKDCRLDRLPGLDSHVAFQ